MKMTKYVVMVFYIDRSHQLETHPNNSSVPQAALGALLCLILVAKTTRNQLQGFKTRLPESPHVDRRSSQTSVDASN